MKTIAAIILSFCLLPFATKAQTEEPSPRKLFPILENQVWGYMDASGQIAISPQFYQAGHFTEGLAPVRVQGSYGYIDQSGQVVIPPAYDKAYNFDGGLAQVYEDGKPYFIDQTGKRLFDHRYKGLKRAGLKDRFIVATLTDKNGIVDREGNLVVDTVYKTINPFKEGLAVVYGLNHDPYTPEEKEKIYECGAINPAGQIVIPYGQFTSITAFESGLAKAILPLYEGEKLVHHKSYINQKGEVQFKVPRDEWDIYFRYENFSEGLAIVSIKGTYPDGSKSNSYPNDIDYFGAVNTQGEIVLSDTQWAEMTPFHKGRAFVQTKDENWHLINREGQVLSKEPFEKGSFPWEAKEPKDFFQADLQLVKTKNGWTMINLDGERVTSPQDFEFDYDFGYYELSQKGSMVIIEEDISVESDRYSYRYGFWDPKSGLVVAPQFHHVDFNNLNRDLIHVVEDDLIGYIDRQGNYIWREQSPKKQGITKLNIDFMNRGYFYASSPYVEELAGFDGWGGSENQYQKIKNAQGFPANDLAMEVRAESKATYREQYEGMPLYLANTTTDTFFFKAQDSRLYLKLQAKNPNGEWKDIEYLPSSWCGNSYHTLFLPPGRYWEFTIPRYEGAFETQLRAELVYRKSPRKKDKILYSNEFSGSVNPGQFWSIQGYTPSGLMDPYND